MGLGVVWFVIEGMRCFILPHVVMVHTCCIQPDLMLVPRPRVDVGAERTMTRFLFFGYTLAYSPRFQRSNCIENIIRFYPFVCIQPDGRLEESNLASAKMVVLCDTVIPDASRSSQLIQSNPVGGKIKGMVRPHWLYFSESSAQSSAKHPLVRACKKTLPHMTRSFVEGLRQNFGTFKRYTTLSTLWSWDMPFRHLYISC